MENEEEHKLYRLDINMTCREDGELGLAGSELLSTFKRAIRSTDPMASRILDSSYSSEIVVNPPIPPVPWKAWCGTQEFQVNTGDSLEAGVVLFNSNLLNPLRVWLLKKPIIRLGEISLEVKDAFWSEHTYDSLITKEPLHSFRIKFLTPTCLRKASTVYCDLYPSPRKILFSLSALWNLRSPVKCPRPKIISTWAALSIVETGYELCTSRPIPLGADKSVVGFVGWVNYKVIEHPGWEREAHSSMAAWANTLFRFGEICGVGVGRSVGFGRIHLELKKQ